MGGHFVGSDPHRYEALRERLEVRHAARERAVADENAGARLLGGVTGADADEIRQAERAPRDQTRDDGDGKSTADDEFAPDERRTYHARPCYPRLAGPSRRSSSWSCLF